MLLGATLLPAQTKKIVLYNPGANQVQDFQAVSSKVTLSKVKNVAGAAPDHAVVVCWSQIPPLAPVQSKFPFAPVTTSLTYPGVDPDGLFSNVMVWRVAVGKLEI